MTMTNPYITALAGPGREVFDLAHFTSALCRALGGVLSESEPGSWQRMFMLPYAHPLRVFVSTAPKLGRVTLSTAPVPEIDRVARPRSGWMPFPEITVDSGRPMGALVVDIKRRLIDPSAAPLAKAYELVMQATNNANTLKAAVEALKAAYPTVKVTLSNDGEHASVYFNEPRTGYMQGTLYADGHIAFQRLTVEGPARTRAILDALTKELPT